MQNEATASDTTLTPRPTILKTIYCFLFQKIIEPFVRFFYFSTERKNSEKSHSIHSALKMFKADERPLIWFHAASMELENLWTVIEEFKGKKVRLVLTVFSESAISSLKKLQSEFDPDQIAFLGYCPFEGRWGKAIGTFRPNVFVTAKYEAWPELWSSAAELRVPIITVGAKLRKSLVFANLIGFLLARKTPQHHFLTLNEKDSQKLKRAFLGATMRVVSDPRWDRVKNRSDRANPKLQPILARFKSLEHPWGVLGSVWPECIEMWGTTIRSTKGTLWIVPHDVSDHSIREMEGLLRRLGIRWQRTSKLEDLKHPFVLVDQMGFLTELYQYMDWAYIGGGFGKGIHNTIEPAIQGIPIACGPRKVQGFSETAELISSSQLTVCSSQSELATWVELASTEYQKHREEWKQKSLSHLGGTEKVLAVIESLLK